MSADASKLPEPLADLAHLADPMALLSNEIDQLRDRLALTKANGGVLPNLLDAMRVELTYNSNAIEGSTLTLRETQLVIDGQSPADKPLREIYEARNHDRALRAIEQRATKTPITLDDVLETHSTVMADIDTTGAGRLRSGRVLIAGSGFIPPGPHKFDELIPVMLNLANRTNTHALLAAAELHYNLVAIHPFNDGNGRTARLMMNDLLLRRGYSMCIIDVRHRAEYLRTLDDANEGNLEPFASFIARSAIATMKKMLG